MLTLLAGLMVLIQSDDVTFDINKAMRTLETEGAEAALSYCTNKGEDPYEIGRRILNARGTNDALTWYKEMAVHTENPHYLFGMARAHWRARAVDNTRKLCLEIMEMEPDTLLMARTHYMLGRIEGYSRNYRTAQAYYKKSFSLYEDLGKNGGRYLACYGMADALIKGKKLGEARAYIEQAREFNDLLSNPYPDAHLHELEGEIAFELQDFNTALQWYQKADTSYFEERDITNGANVRVKVALCYALLGEYKKAYDIATTVDQHVQENQLIETYHFNSLVWMFLYRCGNLDKDFKRLQKGFLSHVEKGPRDTVLIEAQQFLDKLPCPEKSEE